jgi:hypothetical protein
MDPRRNARRFEDGLGRKKTRWVKPAESPLPLPADPNPPRFFQVPYTQVSQGQSSTSSLESSKRGALGVPIESKLGRFLVTFFRLVDREFLKAIFSRLF